MGDKTIPFPPSQAYHSHPFEFNPSLNPIPYPPPQHSVASSPAVPMHPPPPAVVVESTAFPEPYYLHHHPNPSPVVQVVHTNPEQQKIHTLFVSGLPDDVKAREIHNLFRRRQGFDSCQLKYTGRGNQVVAFATFINHQSAMAAMNALNGVIFDPQTEATLHIELARSNSRKRPRGGATYSIIDMRVKATKDGTDNWSDDGDGGSDEPSGTENDNSSNKGALAAAQSGDSGEAPPKQDNLQAFPNSEKPLSDDIPPCSTLFIANLGPTCTEEELKQVLSQYPGFHTLKMRGKGGMPVAFADFMDVEASTAAMNGLKGALLASSDRGGMHLEYARSKMRKSQM